MTNPEELMKRLLKLYGDGKKTHRFYREDFQALAQAINLIASLTPKPISEAPRDENIGIFVFPNMTTTSWDLEKECYTKWSQYWDDTVPLKQQPTHYIPLSALTALMKG